MGAEKFLMSAEERLSYGKSITVGMMRDSFWSQFIGQGNGKIIKIAELAGNSVAGTTTSIRIRGKLAGAGITGDQEFAENTGNQTNLYQTAVIESFGNSVKSKKDINILTNNLAINFRAEAQEDLEDWSFRAFDYKITKKLSSNLTNIVASSKVGDYSVNDVTKIVKGDKFSCADIDEVLKRNNHGVDGVGAKSPKLKPVIIEETDTKGIKVKNRYYVLVLHSTQYLDLTNDQVWIEYQKNAPQSNMNNVFTGQAGMYKGVIIIDGGAYQENEESGMLTSNEIADYEASDGSCTAVGLFLGENAMVFGSDSGFMVTDDTYDVKTKLEIAIKRTIAIAKTNPSLTDNMNSVYNGKDYGVIGIISSIEDSCDVV
jgi:hypothetical protein